MEIYIPDEIWRHILSYLALPYTMRVSKYLHALEEDLNEERYRLYITRYRCVDAASKAKDWDVARFLLHKRYAIVSEYNVCKYGIKHGYRNITRQLVAYGIHTRCYESMAYFAAQYGHRDILQDMLDLGVNEYNTIVHVAAMNGHKDIIQLMLSAVDVRSQF